MVNVGYRELIHKKGKFVLIIFGLSLSIFLVQYSAGMFNGVLTQSTEVIDKFKFDAWIRDKDSDHFFEESYLNDSIYYELQDFKKVDHVERLIYMGVEVEDEKRTTFCYLFGCDFDNPDHEIGPWDVVKGNEGDLYEGNTIIVDESIRDYFKLKIDDYLDVGKIRMKVVGFCENSRFMFNGYIWASLETTKKIAPWLGNWSATIAVNLKDGFTFEEFKEDVGNNIDKDLNVLTPEELKENSHTFIVNEGGLGGAIYILVGMGFFVALIILTVTMYQSIQEKIPVFGTLKALGCSKGFINKMLFGQVFVYITLSFILGSILAVLLSFMGGAMPILVNFQASLILYAVFLLMGFGCSSITIIKVHRIDPAIVYKTI
ncbi:MAG: ABC transporter permease [Promethearchaeota archaeon]